VFVEWADREMCKLFEISTCRKGT